MELDDLRHPDAERLAEYADGVLTAEARTDVEHHLSRCAECRAVVMETTAFLETMASGRDDGGSAWQPGLRRRQRSSWPFKWRGRGGRSVQPAIGRNSRI